MLNDRNKQPGVWSGDNGGAAPQQRKAGRQMLEDVQSRPSVKGLKPSFGEKGLPQLSIDQTVVVKSSPEAPEKVQMNRGNKQP
jgi:hypothetical protein